MNVTDGLSARKHNRKMMQALAGTMGLIYTRYIVPPQYRLEPAFLFGRYALYIVPFAGRYFWAVFDMEEMTTVALNSVDITYGMLHHKLMDCIGHNTKYKQEIRMPELEPTQTGDRKTWRLSKQVVDFTSASNFIRNTDKGDTLVPLSPNGFIRRVSISEISLVHNGNWLLSYHRAMGYPQAFKNYTIINVCGGYNVIDLQIIQDHTKHDIYHENGNWMVRNPNGPDFQTDGRAFLDDTIVYPALNCHWRVHDGIVFCDLRATNNGRSEERIQVELPELKPQQHHIEHRTIGKSVAESFLTQQLERYEVMRRGELVYDKALAW